MIRPLAFTPLLFVPVFVSVVALALGAAGGRCFAQEPGLSPDERTKLDTFEGVSIDKADKVFVAKDFPRAVAEYDAFILQFPESKLVPYAILRKGRSLQELQKRFEAVKIYQEVLDFFPDDVKYAAAALFRIGECHAQNGDIEKAIKAWADMAEDADYIKEPLAASALNSLAENLIKRGKADEGIERFEQVAVEFRGTNPDAARAAIRRVVPHHIRTKPDAKKLRDFYVAARTFEHNPQEPGADAATDGLFWGRTREAIKAHGQFTDLQRDQRDAYYRYWAGQMAGKFPADDGFQIDLANFIRAYEGDEAAWMARLDKQFADHQKEGDYGRVVTWIGLYAKNRAKVEEYLQKLDFSKMSNTDILGLVSTILTQGGDPALAWNAFDKLRLGEMDDAGKAGICNWMRDRWQYPGSRELAIRACQAFQNADAGKMQLLRFFHWRCQHGNIRKSEDFDDGLGLAAEMQKQPATAREAFLLGGNMLQWSAKPEEAIKAYQQADTPPQTLFWIAECFVGLGKLEPAVAQLREVENFFKDRAPEAALRIAYLYRDAGIKDKYVRSLRGVLKKYPQSGQSSEAHQRLEEMGLPIGGGVDAEE
ncbi:MAG: Outer rane lipoprotein [Verrucomicrobiota bacterium]